MTEKNNLQINQPLLTIKIKENYVESKSKRETPEDWKV